MVASGVDSSCAAPGRQRGQRRQPLLARHQVARRLQLGVARGERAADPKQEVDDERRRHAEGDPHPLQVQAHVLDVRVAELERPMPEEEDRRRRQRQQHQRPGPGRAQDHRRERDRHQVKEAERVHRPAREVEQPAEHQDVEHHGRTQPPASQGDPGSTQAPGDAGQQREREQAAQRPDRDRRPHGVADDHDRDQLSRQRAPAQLQQPGEVGLVLTALDRRFDHRSNSILAPRPSCRGLHRFDRPHRPTPRGSAPTSRASPPPPWWRR